MGRKRGSAKKNVRRALLLLLVLTICGCGAKKEYISTEEGIWNEKPQICAFPEEIEYALLMDYVETDTFAGFTYNDINHLKTNIINEYFVLRMSELSGKNNTSEELEKCKEKLRNEQISINALNFDEILFLSRLSKLLNCFEHNDEIEQIMESLWDETEGVYSSQKAYGRESKLADYALTWYVLEIYDNIESVCPHLEEIARHFDNNVESILMQEPDAYAGLLIRVAARIDHHSSYDDIFKSWIVAQISEWVPTEDVLDDLDIIEDCYECALVYDVKTERIDRIIDNMVVGDRIPPGYDELKLRVILQYNELCNKYVKKTNMPCNLDAYVYSAKKTDFSIRGSGTISLVYTYYGIMLADYVGFSYDKEKVKKTIELALDTLVGVEKQTFSFEYLMNTFFTLLCAKKMCVEIPKSVEQLIRNNIKKLLGQFDYTDIDGAKEKLNLIQFCYESIRMLDGNLPYKHKVKEYIDGVVKLGICKNSVSISDLAIIYEVMNIDIPLELTEQVGVRTKSWTL